MTRDEFDLWAIDYCNLFRLKPESLIGTLETWFEAFDANHCTTNELKLALAAMRRNPPEYDREHFRVLSLHVRHLRAEQSAAMVRAASQPKEEEYGICDLCGSTGWVTVPHPRCVREGDFWPPHYELAVYCRCGLGRWFYDNHSDMREAMRRQGRTPGVSIDVYEAWNPKWREQLEHRRHVEDTEWRAIKADKARSLVPKSWREAVEQVSANMVNMDSEP
jgi:hypothetical protein